MGHYDDNGNHILVPCKWENCNFYREIPGVDVRDGMEPLTPHRCLFCTEFVRFHLMEPKGLNDSNRKP